MSRLKQYRKEAGYTQKGLCRACGWEPSQTRISKYEADERQPSVEDMRAIVAALRDAGVKCSLDDVFPPKQSSAA